MAASPGSVDTTNILSVCVTDGVVDPALLKEMLGYFIDENHRRMTQAAAAVANVDREALRQIAHAVRGSAAMLAAGYLQHLATALERDALVGDLDSLTQAVSAMKTEFIAVLAALRARHPDACA
ncbi:MAG TPA: Hpt domain-containing protein [Vicinamibacterales bacterium]|nr:Hpt domain-containing protein [Vicinamibacterales bacterium]